MAVHEHLDVIRRGRGALAHWRLDNPDIVLDLSGAGLYGAGLAGAGLAGAILTRANLFGANLTRAILTRANLTGANLTRAILTRANLTGANLTGANLFGANLVGANLVGANLTGAILTRANLTGANLTGANLFGANLVGANLVGANLTGADLFGANLAEADLAGANLVGANLSRASLVEVNLEKADLTGSRIYGVSVWNPNLHGAKQSNLVITRPNEPALTVDNLEVAQFIYLMLHNEKIRDIIDTLTSKVVLILGRFTPERKAVLDGIREALRSGGNDFVPVVFDFSVPGDRDITETVTLLARMARFVIADLSDPRSIPQELQAIAPDVAVPIVPLLQTGEKREYAMFQDLRRKYHWVLDVHRYKSAEDLIGSLVERVIQPAEDKRKELSGTA